MMQTVSNYKQSENVLNFQGIAFPVKVADITKFQNMNNIGINLFYLNNRLQTRPLKICDSENYSNYIDLLYMTENKWIFPLRIPLRLD